MKEARKRIINRRQFLTDAAKTVGAALALPTIISSKALGGKGGVAASDKIVFGTIGIGGRGGQDLRTLMQNNDAVVIAHCNCYRRGRESVKATIDAQYGSDIPTYIDFRELLARQDIDAVLSTTGDKNHAMIAVHAMRAGKDLYSEKPGSMTIQEGQAVVETQNRYGRVFQSGAQRMNESNFIFANELVRLGKLGEVKVFVAELATIGSSPYMNFPTHVADAPEPPKEEFWWDAWLGANPWMPYATRFAGAGHSNGYGYVFLYNGNIGEWGSHTHPQALDAMQSTNTGPTDIIFPNNNNGEGLRLIFAGGKEMVLRQGLTPRQCAVQYEGSEGWVGVGDGGLEVKPPSLMAEYNKIVNDFREREQRRGDHMRNLLDCIKSRRLTACNAEVMHRSMSTVHLANISMWLKRDLKWDPVKEEFIGDEAANRLRSRAQREPWAFV